MTPAVYKNLLVKLTFGILLFVGAVSINAQTSAFTYQERPTDNSMAANGSCDTQFRIYAAATGGTQQGVTVTRTVVMGAGGVLFLSGTLPDGGAIFEYEITGEICLDR